LHGILQIYSDFFHRNYDNTILQCFELVAVSHCHVSMHETNATSV